MPAFAFGASAVDLSASSPVPVPAPNPMRTYVQILPVRDSALGHVLFRARLKLFREAGCILDHSSTVPVVVPVPDVSCDRSECPCSHTTAYITPPWPISHGRYLDSWNSATGATKGRRSGHLAEGFPTKYRSASAPSQLPRDRAWKNRPMGV